MNLRSLAFLDVTFFPASGIKCCQSACTDEINWTFMNQGKSLVAYQWECHLFSNSILLVWAMHFEVLMKMTMEIENHYYFE